MLAVLQGIILTMLYSRTPDSFIINLNDKEDDFLFATERYDRKILDTSKELMGRKFHEDFIRRILHRHLELQRHKNMRKTGKII